TFYLFSTSLCFFLFSSSSLPLHLHSFPTRRSSDLNKVWIATDRSRARRCVEACVYGTLDFVGYPRFPAPVEFIAAVIAATSTRRSEERFSRNAETEIVCRLLLEKKKRTNRRSSRNC